MIEVFDAFAWSLLFGGLAVTVLYIPIVIEDA